MDADRGSNGERVHTCSQNTVTPVQTIPDTILSGFLLADPTLKDTAVVVNELGDIGIDHELMAAIEPPFRPYEAASCSRTVNRPLE